MGLGIRVIPILAFGIFFFLFFLFWSCGRCCNCCRPYRRSTTGPKTYKYITAAVVILSAACVAMLIYGFSADSKQSSTFSSIPDLVNNVIAWKDNAIASGKNLINVTSVTIGHINTLVGNANTCQYVSCSSVTSAISQCQSLVNNASDIINRLNFTQLTDIRDQITTQTSNANNYRHLAMIVTLSVLFGVIILQALISMADTLCKKSMQPRKITICKPFTITLTAVIMIFTLIMWILAAILLIIATLFADFCVDPVGNIVTVAKISDNLTYYYLACGNNPTMVNPLNSQLSSIQVAFNKSHDFIATFNQTVQFNCSSPAYIGNVPANAACLDATTTLPQLDGVRIYLFF